MELIADRYRAEVATVAGPVWNPGRDIVSGGLVTILRRQAPADPLVRSRELERLRRYAGTRHAHLADVRAVDLDGNEIRVVCEPVTGAPLDPASPSSRLPFGLVRRIATDLLDALAALHLAGVVHGSVGPSAVLLSADTDERAEPTVTLLPLPLVWPARLSPNSAVDDRCEAATLLLGLLRRAGELGDRDRRCAQDLADALEGMGSSWEAPSTPRAVDPAPGTTPLGAHPAHAPLALSPHSLAPRPATVVPVGRPPDVGPSAPDLLPRGRRPSRRTTLAVSGAGLALAAGVAAVVASMVGGAPDKAAGQAALPTTPRSVAASAFPSPSAGSSSSPSAPPLPTTLPALVDALSADPAAAGPSGPALLDALRGLSSGDGGRLQPAALQLMTLALDDPGIDPRYAAASVAAVAAGPLPGAPSAPSSCVTLVQMTPDPVEQQDARRVLDRLPAWQVHGLPAEQADRIRSLADPVAAAQATAALGPCPAG